MCWVLWCFFFFKQKTAYERRISDWSSDVCSSDLSRALTATPDAIEAMFAKGSAATGDGLPAALDAIAAAAADKKYGLVASQSTYDKALGAIADKQTRIEDQDEAKTTDRQRTRLITSH